MKNSRINGIIGLFLVMFALVAVAARFEDLVVGKLRAERAVVCESTVAVTGVLTASGGVVGAVTGNPVVTDTVTVTDLPATDGAVFDIDLDATGSSTNHLINLGATLTIGADGSGTLVETNTAAAAEYGIRCKINGDVYFILLEKE